MAQRRARALYAFEASGPTELSLPEGAVVDVLEEVNADFWKCSLAGSEGLVQKDYLEEVVAAAPAVPTQNKPKPAVPTHNKPVAGAGAAGGLVYNEGHKGAETVLGAAAAAPGNARQGDASTPFMTGQGLTAKAAAPAKDAKSTAKFRGNWTPEIRNPSNAYGFQGLLPKKEAPPVKPKPAPVVPAPVEEKKPEPVAAPPPVAAKPLPRERVRVTLLTSTYGDAYHATQRRLRNILEAHSIEFEEVRGLKCSLCVGVGICGWVLGGAFAVCWELCVCEGCAGVEGLMCLSRRVQAGWIGCRAIALCLAEAFTPVPLPLVSLPLPYMMYGDETGSFLSLHQVTHYPHPRYQPLPATPTHYHRPTLTPTLPPHPTLTFPSPFSEQVDGAMTHLPDAIARRNELFGISGLRGKYPQLFVDDTFVGSYEECNDINEGGEFKEMLQWRLTQPPAQSAGKVREENGRERERERERDLSKRREKDQPMLHSVACVCVLEYM